MVEKKAKSNTGKDVSAGEAAERSPAQTASTGTVTLMQTGSPIGRQAYQRATLIGLGLNKINRTRTLEDTPAVRGMIAKVKHLVEVME